MWRSIEINVDHSSWPTPPPPHFPAGFHRGSAISSFNIPAMLLLIGQLTTPVSNSGASLSEFWAWVRYLFAISTAPDLRITAAFADLDAHQKAILSDDFGMGAPVYWLIDALNLTGWCPGNAFMSRASALMVTPPPRIHRRGPRKSPDFVFLDTLGKIHVVECKGTQSGDAARAHQFAHRTRSGRRSGGTIQKRAITIVPAHRGQQLVCGLSIAQEGSSYSSDLLVRDPPNDSKVKFGEKDYPAMLDAIYRGTLFKALFSSGFAATAEAIAAPSGPRIDSRRYVSRRFENERQEFISRRREAARAELLDESEHHRFRRGRSNYAGRRAYFDLPMPLLVDGKTFRHVEIEQGMRHSLLREIAETALGDGLITELAPSLIEATGLGIKVGGESNSAELIVGNVFQTTLRLS